MGISTTRILQLFLVGFTGLFLFFIAIYWPMLMSGGGNNPKPNLSVFQDIRADDVSGFPIETTNYKISYERRSDTYYVFVAGSTVSQFVDNKNEAQLALKNKLIADSLCNKNVIFSPTVGISIPEDYKNVSGCN